MLKIGQNWGKIANYPPQCSTKIGSTGHIEPQLVCVGQRAAAANRLSIQQSAVSFFMQSDHLERGSRKIEILYLEAKLQLKQATVRFAGLPRFLRLSSWLYPLWLLPSSLTEEPKTATKPCD